MTGAHGHPGMTGPDGRAWSAGPARPPVRRPAARSSSPATRSAPTGWATAGRKRRASSSSRQTGPREDGALRAPRRAVRGRLALPGPDRPQQRHRRSARPPESSRRTGSAAASSDNVPAGGPRGRRSRHRFRPRLRPDGWRWLARGPVDGARPDPRVPRPGRVPAGGPPARRAGRRRPQGHGLVPDPVGPRPRTATVTGWSCPRSRSIWPKAACALAAPRGRAHPGLASTGPASSAGVEPGDIVVDPLGLGLRAARYGRSAGRPRRSTPRGPWASRTGRSDPAARRVLRTSRQGR